MDLSGLTTEDLQALSTGNMGKVSTEGLKHLVSLQPTPPPQVDPNLQSDDPITAGIRGGLNMVTAGNAPSILGAMNSPLGALKKAASFVGYEPDKGDADIANYLAERDKYRNVYDQSQKDYPKSTFAGQIAGGFVLPAEAMTTVGGGAAFGGLQGLGNSKANDLGSLTKDVGLGGAIGAGTNAVTNAVLPPVMDAIGNVAKPAADWASGKLRGVAEDLGIMHLKPTAGTSRMLGDKGLRSAAGEALDSGAIQPFSKVKSTAQRLDDLLDEVGATKGDITNSSTAQVDPSAVKGKIDQIIGKLKSAQGNNALVERLENEQNDIFSHYLPNEQPAPDAYAGLSGSDKNGIPSPESISLQTSEAEKAAAQGKVNYKLEGKPYNQAQNKIANAWRNAGRDAANDPAFNAANDSFHNLSNASNMADRASALQRGGLLEHMADVGLGTGGVTGLAMGHPAAMIPIAARMATKGRVASTGAYYANQASKGLGSMTADGISQGLQTAGKAAVLSTALPYATQHDPQRVIQQAAGSKFQAPLQSALQRGGDQSFAATYYMLHQQNPEFQKLMEQNVESQ